MKCTSFFDVLEDHLLLFCCLFFYHFLSFWSSWRGLGDRGILGDLYFQKWAPRLDGSTIFVNPLRSAEAAIPERFPPSPDPSPLPSKVASLRGSVPTSRPTVRLEMIISFASRNPLRPNKAESRDNPERLPPSPDPSPLATKVAALRVRRCSGPTVRLEIIISFASRNPPRCLHSVERVTAFLSMASPFASSSTYLLKDDSL